MPFVSIDSWSAFSAEKQTAFMPLPRRVRSLSLAVMTTTLAPPFDRPASSVSQRRYLASFIITSSSFSRS